MKRFRIPFYLIAAAVYPLLFLYSNNLEYVTPADQVRPLVVSLLGMLLAYIVVSLLTQKAELSAILVTVLWLLFSSYGHIYQALHGGAGLAGWIGRHSLLGPLFLVLAAGLVVWIVRARGRAGVSWFLNAGLGVLIAAALVTGGLGFFKQSQGSAVSTARPGSTNVVDGVQAGSAKPDIYYIVLDTYSRQDVIAENIGLDISPFLNALKERGFVIGTGSHSNYDSTRVSLASSLNMDFIPNLDPRFTPDNTNNALLDNYILHSRVRATLEHISYRTVAFATGFGFTEMKDASEYLSPPPPSLLHPEVRPFEALWLKTTALRAMFDIHPAAFSGVLSWLSFPFGAHVQREQFLLDRLPKLAGDPGPKFVFAHVIIPHVPLVFRADGSITRNDRYFGETYDQPASEDYLKDGYRNQVEYINTRMLAIVDEILRKSSQPPVIILQGDHGLLYYNHFPILNAYYFPGTAKQGLYPGITPVNSFRVLFDQYFGAKLALLPDESFTSTYTRPYDFQKVDVK